MIELSLNEVETLSTKAARGAGYSWGLADEIGRAARAIAAESEDWGEALLALAREADAFEAPESERVARWRRGEKDIAGARPLCPVRTAALFLDDPPDLSAGPLEIVNVGVPIWLDAVLRHTGIQVARPDDRLAASGDIAIRRGGEALRLPAGRRAMITAETAAALNVYAERTYVPQSERSRARGAGGGRVDDE